MIIQIIDNMTVLSPEEGYKYITNGEVFSTLVYLGKYDNVENWHDTNEEPPEPVNEVKEKDYREITQANEV